MVAGRDTDWKTDEAFMSLTSGVPVPERGGGREQREAREMGRQRFHYRL